MAGQDPLVPGRGPGRQHVLLDLSARGASRFEWFLHAPAGSLSGLPGGAFVVRRGAMRLWIRPLQPEGLESRVDSCATASDAFDPTACLVLEKDGMEETTGLTLLAVLAAGEPEPRLSFADGVLEIEKGTQRHRVAVTPRGARPSDPLLTLLNARAAEAGYRLVR